MALAPHEGVTPPEVEHEQHVVLSWAAVISVIAVLWLIMPIGAGILLGTFLAFMTQPIFERLKARIGPGGAAAATVTGATLALAALLGGLGWLFVVQGTALAQRFIDELKPGGIADRAVQAVGRAAEHLGLSHEQLETRARNYANDLASRTVSIAASVASTTGGTLLALFFAILAMHYVLRNWSTVAKRAQATLPLRAEYTDALFTEFRRVGRTTLVGAIGTAIAQGVFAWIGYAIAQVPEPGFFGAATAVASFIPVVGVLTVIIPIGAALFALGHPGLAIVELAWCLVTVVALSDYVIRPRLVRGETEVPAIGTFVALFGGVEVFGLKGLIVGPVLMSLALAILRIYADDARKRRGGDA
jgi:predicted PurR-regulated permease PerM